MHMYPCSDMDSAVLFLLTVVIVVYVLWKSCTYKKIPESIAKQDSVSGLSTTCEERPKIRSTPAYVSTSPSRFREGKEIIYERISPVPENREPCTQEDELYSVGDLREKARYHHDERIQYFEMASSAYSLGDGAGAKFYSNKGHQHARLMEEANEDALNLLIEQCEPALQQTNTLDLHGFFVNEGIDYLDEVIEEREEAFTRGKEYLTVITGKGRHSDGRAKLRPTLIEFLNDRRYQYTEETRGVFKFKLHPRNLQNIINTKSRNESSHPMAKKVKKRYLDKEKKNTIVKNRFHALQALDTS